MISHLILLLHRNIDVLILYDGKKDQNLAKFLSILKSTSPHFGDALVIHVRLNGFPLCGSVLTGPSYISRWDKYRVALKTGLWVTLWFMKNQFVTKASSCNSYLYIYYFLDNRKICSKLSTPLQVMAVSHITHAYKCWQI